MERPTTVPADAIWEPSKVPGFEWKQYAVDAEGKKHGLARSWTKDGVLHAETTYVHGQKHGPNKNFHPDGSVSSLGEWRDDVQYDSFYFKSDTPSTEPWPGDAGSAVRKVGYYSTDGTSNCTIRYFDAAGVEVALTGAPLPPRPDGVPDTARWFPDRKEWVDGAIARGNNKQVGQWRWWTADGWLRHEEQRDERGEAGTVIEYHRNGKRSEQRTKLADGGERWEVWHDNGVQKIKKHTDGKKRELYLGRWGDDGAMWDEKTTVYDGDALVSVSERDTGGELVFEARREGPAISCRSYASGALTATGMLRDGKLDGTWQLFDGDRVRREVDMTPLALAQKPTAQGLMWRLGDALYRIDEPGLATPDELRGVDDVAWDELETAYGSAKGFERYLRAVVAPDPLVRMCGRGKLGGQIEHQGSTYPSTAAVIPWLAKLLAHPNADRHAMLAQIRGLGAAALPYLDEVAPDDEAWPAIGGVIEAIRAAWPQIFALFAAGGPDIKREIVVIGKAVPAARHELRDIARRDADPAMRACAIDALVATSDYELDDVVGSLADIDPLVRAACAISIGRTRGPGAPESVVAGLREALAGWRAISDRWSALPFTDGHVLAHVALATGAIRSAAARALAADLCASLDAVDGVSAIPYGQGLLALAFGRGERPFAPTFVDILAAVARSPKFWAFNVNAHEVLALWNLPRDQRALEALLGELRTASDPEAHLRAKLDIREPADEPEPEEEKDAPEPAPAPIDPSLAELVRLAEHPAELCARPDAVAQARALLEAVPEAARQQAAQHVQQIAGDALKRALDGDSIVIELAALADDLFALGRAHDRRPEHSRIWQVGDGRAEPAMFALAAGRYERAEALAREQLRDSRCLQLDNHALLLVLARAAAGAPPAEDVVLADPKYDSRTSDRISPWLARQPIAVVERVLDAVPPETRLALLVDWKRANVVARISQPLMRVIAAMEAVLDRIAGGVLPATVGGATSPLSELVWVDGPLRWFFKKPRVPIETDEDRRLVGRGWQLYSYLVNASQRYYDDKYVREAIGEAQKLGVAADWIAELTAGLDRDALDPAFAGRAAAVLPKLAGAGAIVGRSVGELCEKVLPERARERLLELVLEHAPALAWPVLAAMTDGAQRWRTTKVALGCPEVAGGFHALRILGAGEILNRLIQDSRTATDIPRFIERVRGHLALIQLYSERQMPERIVELADALLARSEIAAYLATEPDHVVWRGFSLARQPIAVSLAYCAQRAASRDHDPPAAVALYKAALRFPRARAEAARGLLRIVGDAITPDEARAATAGIATE